ALFLTDRDAPVPGAAVFAGIEGTRPVLCEFQALVASSPLGQPRRQVLGWDGGRLAMILAVLDARAGISFAGMDVYLNIAGGLRVSDPSADLAVAAALLSALRDRALPVGTVLFGELSLSGALRPAGLSENRLKEAGKLGFSKAFLSAGTLVPAGETIEAEQFSDLSTFAGEKFGAAAG
ncbi:MAG: magnesium chelatase domain-containing protein, partial [Pseudomonadota bacterium]